MTWNRYAPTQGIQSNPPCLPCRILCRHCRDDEEIAYVQLVRTRFQRNMAGLQLRIAKSFNINGNWNKPRTARKEIKKRELIFNTRVLNDLTCHISTCRSISAQAFLSRDKMFMETRNKTSIIAHLSTIIGRQFITLSIVLAIFSNPFYTTEIRLTS